MALISSKISHTFSIFFLNLLHIPKLHFGNNICALCVLFIVKFLKYVFLNNANGLSMLITQIPNPCTLLNEKSRENEPQNENTFIWNFTKIPAHFIKYPAISSIFFAWFCQYAFLFGWFSSKFQSVMDLSYTIWHIHLFV